MTIEQADEIWNKDGYVAYKGIITRLWVLI